MYICIRCGSTVLALLEGGLCASCYSIDPVTGIEKLKRKRKKKKYSTRKKKSKHNLEQNVLTYLLYVLNNPEVVKLQKRDFESEMGIPVTSVNYLITVLKKRGYIETVGIVGKQHYAPIRLFIDCILVRINNLREQVHEFTICKKESTSSSKEENQDT